MFLWTEEMLRFRVDAAHYNGFERLLAKQLRPFLSEGCHVCDAGCGIGALALELGQLGYRVTAVDTDASALGLLRQGIAKRGLRGITAVQDDIFSMQPQTPYDAMVFCFFGKTEETLRVVKRQCGGKAILVKKAWQSHRFSLECKPLERFTFLQTCRELDALGISYQTHTFRAQTGQPFASLADAVRFFKLYEKSAAVTEQTVLPLLKKTELAEFPYAYPTGGEVGIIVLDAAQLSADDFK